MSQFSLLTIYNQLTTYLIGISGIVLFLIWFKYRNKKLKLLQVKKLDKNYIFIDIETTGLRYQSGDKIVEIACFYYNKDGSSKILNYYINPERLIPQAVVNIHGINNEMVKDSPKFSEIGQQFLDFIADGILVGHNIRKFDIPFINSELKAANLKTINNNIVDTLEMFREKFPGQSAKLDNACKMFNIDLNERNKNGHGALLDARLAAACFEKMMSN